MSELAGKKRIQKHRAPIANETTRMPLRDATWFTFFALGFDELARGRSKNRARTLLRELGVASESTLIRWGRSESPPDPTNAYSAGEAFRRLNVVGASGLVSLAIRDPHDAVRTLAIYWQKMWGDERPKPYSLEDDCLRALHRFWIAALQAGLLQIKPGGLSSFLRTVPSASAVPDDVHAGLERACNRLDTLDEARLPSCFRAYLNASASLSQERLQTLVDDLVAWDPFVAAPEGAVLDNAHSTMRVLRAAQALCDNIRFYSDLKRSLQNAAPHLTSQTYADAPDETAASSQYSVPTAVSTLRAADAILQLRRRSIETSAGADNVQIRVLDALFPLGQDGAVAMTSLPQRCSACKEPVGKTTGGFEIDALPVGRMWRIVRLFDKPGCLPEDDPQRLAWESRAGGWYSWNVRTGADARELGHPWDTRDLTIWEEAILLLHSRAWESEPIIFAVRAAFEHPEAFLDPSIARSIYDTTVIPLPDDTQTTLGTIVDAHRDELCVPSLARNTANEEYVELTYRPLDLLDWIAQVAADHKPLQ
jgi:hypothetical protein